jgi:hypothetical protein
MMHTTPQRKEQSTTLYKTYVRGWRRTYKKKPSRLASLLQSKNHRDLRRSYLLSILL